MSEPEFKVGDAVFKHSGEYTGPGVVRAVFAKPSGSVRYVVGHTIAGGAGEFLHVYAAANLRPTSL